MNRIAATYLLILYTAFTTGMSVDIHYCGGKISSITFDKETNKDVCSKCNKEKKGCCRDIVSFFKVDDAHSVAVATEVATAPYLIIASNYFEQLFLLQKKLYNNISKNHHPPSSSPPDINICNCVFRI